MASAQVSEEQVALQRAKEFHKQLSALAKAQKEKVLSPAFRVSRNLALQKQIDFRVTIAFRAAESFERAAQELLQTHLLGLSQKEAADFLRAVYELEISQTVSLAVRSFSRSSGSGAKTSAGAAFREAFASGAFEKPSSFSGKTSSAWDTACKSYSQRLSRARAGLVEAEKYAAGLASEAKWAKSRPLLIAGLAAAAGLGVYAFFFDEQKPPAPVPPRPVAEPSAVETNTSSNPVPSPEPPLTQQPAPAPKLVETPVPLKQKTRSPPPRKSADASLQSQTPVPSEEAGSVKLRRGQPLTPKPIEFPSTLLSTPDVGALSKQDELPVKPVWQKSVPKMSSKDVSSVVSKHQPALRSLFELQLRRYPNLGGKAVVEFHVEQDGSVSSAKIKSIDRDLDYDGFKKGLLEVVKSMKFPRSDEGAVISYPFVFQQSL